MDPLTLLLPALAAIVAGATALLVTRNARRDHVRHLPSSGVLPASLPFSEGVAVGRTVFLSGQLGVRPGTLELVNDTPDAEFRQVMDNIAAVLAANGMSTANLVKVTVMLRDIADWPAFNAVYETYVQRPYPARSAFAASGLALGARVEVECIAVR